MCVTCDTKTPQGRAGEHTVGEAPAASAASCAPAAAAASPSVAAAGRAAAALLPPLSFSWAACTW